MNFNDVNYDKYATKREKEILEALRDAGSQQKAADKLGVSRSRIKGVVKRVKAKAIASGYIPENGMNEPFNESLSHQKSTVHVKDGKVVQYWARLKPEEEALEQAMLEKIENLSSEIPARPVIKNNRTELNADLLNMYTFSDYHVGMLAWHKEGGDNWNLDIATDTLKMAYSDMVERSPKSKTCLVNELGDWEHYTSMLSVTPGHGHILDADSRPEKMIAVSFDLMDYLVAESLKHHEEVVVSIAPGNHNDFIALARKKAMMMLYRDNKRVKFIDSKTPYSAYVFGKTLLGFHHGHKRKPPQLPELFNNAYRDLLSETDQTVIHTGHQHHKEVKEYGKTTVEMHRTLAARDGHASHGGWFSDRSTDAITYHKDHGEFSRVTIYPHLYGDC